MVVTCCSWFRCSHSRLVVVAYSWNWVQGQPNPGMRQWNTPLKLHDFVASPAATTCSRSGRGVINSASVLPKRHGSKTGNRWHHPRSVAWFRAASCPRILHERGRARERFDYIISIITQPPIHPPSLHSEQRVGVGIRIVHTQMRVDVRGKKQRSWKNKYSQQY